MLMHRGDAAVHHRQQVLHLLLALALRLAWLTRVVLLELGLEIVDTMRICHGQAMAMSYVNALKDRVCTSFHAGAGNLTLGITFRGTKSHCSPYGYHKSNGA
jgi:hypothetical protein